MTYIPFSNVAFFFTTFNLDDHATHEIAAAAGQRLVRPE